MKLRQLILTGLLLTLIIAESSGQTTPNEIAEKFFSIYSKDPLKAVDYAFSTNKWFDKQKDAVVGVKNKIKNLTDLVGDYYGYELLAEKSAGPSVKILTFIAKYDREPLRFIFLMYKAKDSWRVNNFSFDEDIGDELTESAKAYRLKENY
jgi:hypothetical protein